ncbi:MAG: alcohol dehydrogenase catalytic domain-containing protein [Acidobacteria bacterium]|nr:alcohol dehydrogenase catalytic domain-containing protein [Acidobacteriota bacterium]
MPEPDPAGPREVLLRVHQAGVCGTDRELAQFRYGYPPAGVSHMILGHEALGQVIGTGEWVVPVIRRACAPPCASCARGRRDLCLTSHYRERGIFGAHGYFCDWAADDPADLVGVPPELADRAVLVEPMSVVEKAIARACQTHPGEPATALVLGAGPIGVLAALALRLRGLGVSLASLEPRDHPRARLLERAGIQYSSIPDRTPPMADIVIEAAGAPAAALAAVQSLNPLGVAVLLGAPEMPPGLPLLDFIAGNCTVLGSVNAGPESFAAAVEDLACLDSHVLDALIRRAAFGDFAASILGPPGEAVKIVHILAE